MPGFPFRFPRFWLGGGSPGGGGGTGGSGLYQADPPTEALLTVYNTEASIKSPQTEATMTILPTESELKIYDSEASFYNG